VADTVREAATQVKSAPGNHVPWAHLTAGSAP
jgi:hypothetical protein